MAKRPERKEVKWIFSSCAQLLVHSRDYASTKKRNALNHFFHILYMKYERKSFLDAAANFHVKVAASAA